MDVSGKIPRRTLIFRALLTSMAALPLAACRGGAGAATAAVTTAPATSAAPGIKASSAGAATPSASTAKQASAAPVQIVVSQWTDQSPAVKAFSEQFPQIKVDYSSFGDTSKHYERVKSAAAAGQPEDAFWLDNSQIPTFVGGGLVYPIDDFVRRDPTLSKAVFPTALQFFTQKGKLYGIAQNLSVFVVYYDQDRFAAAGVPLPTADWTLDAWSEAARRLANDAAKQSGVVMGTDMRGYWIFVKAMGGGWIDPQGTRSRLTDPETISGMQFIKDLFDQKVATRPVGSAPYGFQNGAAGMLIELNSEAAWALRKAETPFKWDLAEPPKGTKGRGTGEAGTAWVLSEGGKHLDAAWQFASWMTGEQAQRLLTAANALIPSLRDVALDPKVNPPPPANLQAVADAHGYADFDAVPSNVIADPKKAQAFMDALHHAFDLIFSGKASVHDALFQADALVAQQKVFAQ